MIFLSIKDEKEYNNKKDIYNILNTATKIEEIKNKSRNEYWY